MSLSAASCLGWNANWHANTHSFQRVCHWSSSQHSFDYQQAYKPAFEALHHDAGAAQVSPFQASGDCYMFQEPTI